MKHDRFIGSMFLDPASEDLVANMKADARNAKADGMEFERLSSVSEVERIGRRPTKGRSRGVEIEGKLDALGPNVDWQAIIVPLALARRGIARGRRFLRTLSQ